MPIPEASLWRGNRLCRSIKSRDAPSSVRSPRISERVEPGEFLTITFLRGGPISAAPRSCYTGTPYFWFRLFMKKEFHVLPFGMVRSGGTFRASKIEKVFSYGSLSPASLFSCKMELE